MALNYCEICGTALHPNQTHCPQCGHYIAEAALYPETLFPAEGEGMPFAPEIPPLPNRNAWQGTVQYTSLRDAQTPDLLTVADYLGMFAASFLPIVGVILLFYWAFSTKSTRSRKNFAKAYLCIVVFLSLIVAFFCGIFLFSFPFYWYY